jgi:hypothetical protein
MPLFRKLPAEHHCPDPLTRPAADLSPWARVVKTKGPGHPDLTAKRSKPVALARFGGRDGVRGDAVKDFLLQIRGFRSG